MLFLFAVELVLGGLFLVDRIGFRPSGQLHLWLDFEHEPAAATWFSSMQLFCVSLVLGLFSWGVQLEGERDRLLLVSPPLLFLVLSADEVIQIHEWLGYKMFTYERRTQSIFDYVGIWGFVLGPLLLLCIGWIGWRGRRYLQADRSVLRRFIVGFLLFVGAGAFVEELANFVERDGTAHMFQVFSEELGEMVGVTFILWASWDLLRRHALKAVVERATSRQGSDLNS